MEQHAENWLTEDFQLEIKWFTCGAGFLIALLTERCFFIDFPFFHRAFAPDLDFSWAAHSQRLAAFGHDVNTSQPFEIKFWKGEDLNTWLMQDQKAFYNAHYGIVLKNDPDYSAALLQANPYHAPFLRNIFPTGEMFQPLAHFLFKVRAPLYLLLFGIQIRI